MKLTTTEYDLVDEADNNRIRSRRCKSKLTATEYYLAGDYEADSGRIRSRRC